MHPLHIKSTQTFQLSSKFSSIKRFFLYLPNLTIILIRTSPPSFGITVHWGPNVRMSQKSFFSMPGQFAPIFPNDLKSLTGDWAKRHWLLHQYKFRIIFWTIIISESRLNFSVIFAFCFNSFKIRINSGEGDDTPLQYSCLENPMYRGAWWAAVHGVAQRRTLLSDCTFTFHLHALGKEMTTHSSVLAWRIPGTGEPGGLPSMGSHRVRHDWSDLAAAAG